MYKKREFKSTKDILTNKSFLERYASSNKYITKEFQDMGVRLAEMFNDTSRISFYIKIAKEVPRSKIELAMQFVADYPRAKNKGKIFIWKLSKIHKLKFTGHKKKMVKKDQKQLNLI